MAAWPASLPQYMNADDYTETRVDGTIRTSMDAGPDFVRRRYTAVPTRFSGSLILTDTQVATLDTFYYTSLNGGVDEIEWDHPRTGASVSMRFLSPPSYRAFTNDLWQAQLSLEILP